MRAVAIGTAVLLIALAVPAAVPADTIGVDTPLEVAGEPLFAESSGNSVLTLGVEVRETDSERPTLSLRGNRASSSDSAPFKVDADLFRIPCSGEYQFEAAQEDAVTGNSATYTALVKLFDPLVRPPGARCGVSPPSLPGRLSVSVDLPEGEPFSLRGSRSTAGPFKGKLSFVRFVQCNRPYRLRTAIDLPGWQHSYEFKMRVIEVKVTLQGRKLPNQRC